ncbi:MAG: phospholipase C [Solirubrobacteraceae bacterium]
MGGVTRRELLQAGAGAGVLAMGAANPLVRAAMAKKLPPAELTDIEHVVILIQENRSFDHYFGMLPGVRGFGDTSVPRSRFEQSGYPVEGYGGVLLPFHPETGPEPGQRCFPDITHSWTPQHESWDDGAMDGFVRTHLAVDGSEAGPATMGYYERQDIPFYWALAENFTICDNYFCSVLGPTYPNRLYAMTATLDPEGTNGGPLVETYEDFEYLRGRFTWRTMPEQLTAAGITWKSYTGAELGYEDNMLEFFANFQTDPELKAKGLEPVYPNDFVADLKREELPQVSWVNTSALQTEHPGYSSAKVGEYVVENLIARLHKHNVWDKTALFVTWDENGGFFDHVAPPVAPPGTAGEYLTVPDITGDDGGITGPIGLGFRVPLLVLGPFSRGGFLCSDQFDHTSLLRFLETRFGVEVPNLSAWRRENTGDLTSALNLVQPNNTKGKLPKIALTKAELDAGACERISPLAVPPNSFPHEESREWRRPSGP